MEKLYTYEEYELIKEGLDIKSLLNMLKTKTSYKLITSIVAALLLNYSVNTIKDFVNKENIDKETKELIIQ